MSTGPEPAWWAIDWLENRANALEFGDLRPWKMVLRVGLGRLSAMSGMPSVRKWDLTTMKDGFCTPDQRLTFREDGLEQP